MRYRERDLQLQPKRKDLILLLSREKTANTGIINIISIDQKII